MEWVHTYAGAGTHNSSPGWPMNTTRPTRSIPPEPPTPKTQHQKYTYTHTPKQQNTKTKNSSPTTPAKTPRWTPSATPSPRAFSWAIWVVRYMHTCILLCVCMDPFFKVCTSIPRHPAHPTTQSPSLYKYTQVPASATSPPVPLRGTLPACAAPLRGRPPRSVPCMHMHGMNFHICCISAIPDRSDRLPPPMISHPRTQHTTPDSSRAAFSASIGPSRRVCPPSRSATSRVRRVACVFEYVYTCL